MLLSGLVSPAFLVLISVLSADCFIAPTINSILEVAYESFFSPDLDPSCSVTGESCNMTTPCCHIKMWQLSSICDRVDGRKGSTCCQPIGAFCSGLKYLDMPCCSGSDCLRDPDEPGPNIRWKCAKRSIPSK